MSSTETLVTPPESPTPPSAAPVRKKLGWMPRLRTVIALGILGAVDCSSAPQRPTVTPRGTLSPQGEPNRGAAQPPFRVVFSAPQNDAASGAEISIVFSRPLRALDLAERQPTPPVSLEPPIAGRWQWVGTHALCFVPEQARLPGATEFKVEVPAETRSLDGATLGRPHRFTFRTPRPKLVRSTPASETTGLTPRATIDLRYNQPIEPAILSRNAELRATVDEKTSSLGFELRRPEPKDPKRLEVVPKNPLPLNGAIELVLGANLTGREGPLPAGEEQIVGFRTYGPLSVDSVSCNHDSPGGDCAPGAELGLTLSNAVKTRDLRAAVSVEPPVRLRWGSEQDLSELSTYASLVGDFQAGQRYTIRLAPGLIDQHGQRLGRPYSTTVQFGDYWPTVEFGATGATLEPSLPDEVPVGSYNLTRYELVTARLSPEEISGFLTRTDDAAGYEWLRKRQGAKLREVLPRGQKNRLALAKVSLRDELGGAGGRGTIALAASYSGPKSPRLHTLEVTDLALTAKWSRYGSLVWVTHLSSGEPAAGAEVSLLRKGNRLASARTDPAGLARFTAQQFVPDFDQPDADRGTLVVAKNGEDWTWRPVQDFIPTWRAPVVVDTSPESQKVGLMFTDRGIYRPGDSVELKGILRQQTPGGHTIPQGARVKLELKSPEGEAAATVDVTTSNFGTFATRVRVPPGAALGQWLVAASLEKREVTSVDLQVAEYRPAEFTVKVESDRPEFVRGDKPTWLVRGDYLFGTVMSGAGLRYSITRTRSWFSPPQSEGFATDEAIYYADLPWQALSSETLSGGEAKLDQRGRAELKAALTLPGQRGPELVTASAEVTDLSRQTVASTSSAIVHPAAFYLAIRNLDDSFLNAPAEVKPEILALTPSGQHLAGVNVKLELIRRRWSLARQETGAGSVHSESRVIDEPVGSCSLTTALTLASCGLRLPDAGYYLVRATGRDAQKNPVGAALSVYAIGTGQSAWKDNDQLAVELVPNKSSYRVGETARLLVKSPFPEAEALVTVERAGVYRAERKHLIGPAPTLEVKITEDLAPNAFVAVHLLRGRTQKPPQKRGQADVGAPTYRLGIRELTVDRESRRLAVEVLPNKANLAPGEELTVALAVRDHQKRPRRAEVTLYAVDEGVLSLIGYQTPDPLPAFTRSRPLGVVTLESRDALARVSMDALQAALGLDKGRDGGGGGQTPGSARKDFRQTAYFNPSVTTDDSGRASVSFKLPDSLTTYRLMAVATSLDDRYGFGVGRVTASKRLMARPALPRFLRAGDDFQASVVVSSRGFGPVTVTVRADAQGLALEGDRTRTVRLGRDESAEVRFSAKASTVGTAKLRFEATAEGARDAVELTRNVASPTSLEAVALYGETRQAAGERLGDMSAIRHDVGELSLSFSSTALVGLDAGFQQLIEYPYGCTEQLASRLLPLLPLRELAKDFAIPLPSKVNVEVERTVTELVERQHGNGGFGLWPDSRDTLSWTSAYVLWTLHQAKQSGVPVSSKVLERAQHYIRSALESPRGGITERAARAFVLDVLAETGAPDPGYMTRLYQERAQLPLFSRALLLHALAVSKSDGKMVTTLAGEIASSLRLEADAAYANENLGDEYAVLMDSPARTSAMVLRALVAHRPGHELASKLARGLLAVRHGGQWRSTQETAYALLALDEYRRAQEKERPDFAARVWFGQNELFSAELRGRSIRAVEQKVPVTRLGSGGSELVFEKAGLGTLFYAARLRYAPVSLPASSLDRGFYLRKSLRKVSPEQLAAALRTVPERGDQSFAGGDLVVADLVVVTPSPREYVVIDDPLPAGLEAVDAGLSTTAAWLDLPGSGGEPDSVDCAGCDEQSYHALARGHAYLSSWYRRELRDDRAVFFVDHMAAGMYHYRYLARATTLGKFVVPPTKAEAMYAPEVFGRTGATRVEVK